MILTKNGSLLSGKIMWLQFDKTSHEIENALEGKYTLILEMPFAFWISC